MNKDNKVFANTISKEIKNNNNFFYSSLEQKEEKDINKLKKVEKNNLMDISKKINKIFNSNLYVYKADVIIKTEKEVLEKKIIGRNKKYIITFDNELIPINEIKDIYIK